MLLGAPGFVKLAYSPDSSHKVQFEILFLANNTFWPFPVNEQYDQGTYIFEGKLNNLHHFNSMESYEMQTHK